MGKAPPPGSPVLVPVTAATTTGWAGWRRHRAPGSPGRARWGRTHTPTTAAAARRRRARRRRAAPACTDTLVPRRGVARCELVSTVQSNLDPGHQVHGAEVQHDECGGRSNTVKASVSRVCCAERPRRYATGPRRVCWSGSRACADRGRSAAACGRSTTVKSGPRCTVDGPPVAAVQCIAVARRKWVAPVRGAAAT